MQLSAYLPLYRPFSGFRVFSQIRTCSAGSQRIFLQKIWDLSENHLLVGLFGTLKRQLCCACCVQRDCAGSKYIKMTIGMRGRTNVAQKLPDFDQKHVQDSRQPYHSESRLDFDQGLQGNELRIDDPEQYHDATSTRDAMRSSAHFALVGGYARREKHEFFREHENHAVRYSHGIAE